MVGEILFFKIFFFFLRGEIISVSIIDEESRV
jgi:hypothetical protein